jgi:predicted enzyme related to lactoylglutathione lyase
MLNNYDNLFLPASDLEQGRRFYADTLGLPVKFDFSARGLLAFNVGNEDAAIILRSDPTAKPAILFEVENVKDTYRELQQKGVVFLSEPYEINTGLAGEFEDPFGNRLGITDYSKRPDLASKKR